ncbi:valyl-tRNA synthetase, partial [Flavobacterium urocaniciphilum]
SSVAPIDLFSLITGEQAGGTWTQTSGTGGTFNAGAGTFTPAPGATTSTFTYTLVGTAPCINDTSVATININAQPNAGVDGNTTVCDSSVAPIDLFSLITGEQAGGTWTRTSGTGGTFNAGAGTYTPAPGATTSTFTYTLTGVAPCTNDTSIATVNINPQPNAGADGNTTVCDSSVAAINLFSLITGEQAGGTWTQTSGTGGTFNAGAGTYTPAPGATTSTFTYTLVGTAPCINDTSVATININAQPNAGTDGNTTVCDSSVAPIDLFSLITGEQAGGTWTQTSGTGGTFNAGAGTYTPAPGATTSTFTYTLVGTAPCTNDTSIATVNINAQPFAGTDVVLVVCPQTASAIHVGNLITDADPGGTWTQISGPIGNFNPMSAIFTPPSGSSASTSVFAYTITGASPCVDDVALVTITVNRQPIAGTDGNTTICDTSNSSIDLFSLITGEDTGGTWTQTSGTGGTFNAGAGTFTPAPGATTSTFAYTLLGDDQCVDVTSFATININPQPNAGADGATTTCESSGATINLFSLITGEQAGGTWTQTSGTGGTFNAGAGTYTPAMGATTSTFTYTLTGTAPCTNDTSIATVTITSAPTAGTNGTTVLCSTSAPIDLFTQLGGSPDIGGTWSPALASGTGVFNPTVDTPGVYTYTINIPGCAVTSATVNVTVNPQPNAGVDGNTTVCDSSVAPIDLFSLITGEQA